MENNTTKTKPSYEYISARYSYNPETGDIISKWFNRALLPSKFSGYVICRTDQAAIHGHRVAWLLHYGRWPTHHLDHINGDPGDNRIINLREATNTQNLWNRPVFRNNKLGVKGVVKTKHGTYRAQCWHNGKFVLNRVFKTIEEASAAYQAKAKEVFGEWHRPS